MEIKRHKKTKSLDVTYTLNTQIAYQAFITELVFKKDPKPTDNQTIPRDFYQKVTQIYRYIENKEKNAQNIQGAKEKGSLFEEEQRFYCKLQKSIKNYQLPTITFKDLVTFYQNKIKALPDDEQQIAFIKNIQCALTDTKTSQGLTFLKSLSSTSCPQEQETVCTSRFVRITKRDDVLRICSKLFGDFRWQKETLRSHFKAYFQEKMIDLIKNHYPKKNASQDFEVSINQLFQFLNITGHLNNPTKLSTTPNRLGWLTDSLKSMMKVKLSWFYSKPEHKNPNQDLKGLIHAIQSDHEKITASTPHGKNGTLDFLPIL